MTSRPDKYIDLSAYGLLPLLREAVAIKRVRKVQPARSTVFDAFHESEEHLTGLHKLILKTGISMLEAHEQEIKAHEQKVSALQPA